MTSAPPDPARILRDVPCGIATGALDGTLSWTNDVLARWLGAEPGTLAGRTLQAFLPPAGRMTFDMHVRPALAGDGHARDVPLRLDGADARPVLLSVSVDREADPASCVTFVLFDATEQRAFEDRLHAISRRSDHLASIVTGAPDGYLTLTRAGRVLMANAAAAAILGADESEALLGSEATSWLPGADAWIGALLGSGAPKLVRSARIVREEDGTRDLDVTLAPLGGGQGRAGTGEPPPLADAEEPALSLVVRDVTDAVATRGRLRATVAELNHRVKNTLAVVQSVAAQTFSDCDEERVEAFSRRLRGMADAHDVLTARGWRDADLAELLGAVLRPLAGPRQLGVAGPPVRVRASDAVMLGMAFRELGDNAARHGALGADTGRVRVSWGAAGADDRIVLRWEEEGGPEPATDAPEGFGALLLTRALPSQLRTEARMERARPGLTYEVAVPVLPEDQG